MTMINSDSGVALYIQLQKILKKKILSGKYTVGEKIPPENELCEIYDVSRITVRKAIDTLVQEKLLYRVQGKGTFVTSLKLRRDLPKLYSFSEEMRELGLVPSSRVLKTSVEKAHETIQALLEFPEGETQVNRIARVRLANNEPILLEKVYIPLYLCPDLLDNYVESDSLYRIFREQYHFVLEHAKENYEVTLMTKYDAEILQCREHDPAFFIERITFLDTDIPVVLTRAIGRGDKLRLTVDLIKNADSQFRRSFDL